jgi:cellulose synthase/poly-beta-1,6-N-acetylglucosamine synthase-like glycosyltransferase
VAFRRSVWESLGGYPEWLDYCEDLLFDMRLRARGYRVAFEARALVAFRPRSSLKAFALQYFRYARGDGKAGILTKRHLIRYATYLVAALVPVTTGRLKVPVFAAASMAAIAYCGGPWRRLKRTQGGRPAGQLLMAMALVPWLRLTGDLAKMLGFPVGVRYRHRHGEGD